MSLQLINGGLKLGATGLAIPSKMGSLTGSVITSSTNQNLNLTTLGVVDWAAFGYFTNAASIERKITGGSKISALSQIGGITLVNFNFNSGWLSTWSDGSPDATASNEGYGVYGPVGAGQGPGPGILFTVPADVATRTLKIYLALSTATGHTALGKLTATLSDGSAPPYVDFTMSNATGSNLLGVYTIIYNALSNGQKLTIRWMNNTAFAQNVVMYAATLN